MIVDHWVCKAVPACWCNLRSTGADWTKQIKISWRFESRISKEQGLPCLTAFKLSPPNHKIIIWNLFSHFLPNNLTFGDEKVFSCYSERERESVEHMLKNFPSLNRNFKHSLCSVHVFILIPVTFLQVALPVSIEQMVNVSRTHV